MSDGTDQGGWRPLSTPRTEPKPAADEPRRMNLDGSPVVSSFVRLARAHALHAAGDATYAVALVGSIFALDTDAARGRILLYLLLTLAPFALVGPFIGPALDRVRGGRRLMIILTLAARAVLMLLLIRNIDTLWLFPIAFTQLVMSKTYAVAKAATVPTTVNSEEELVDKNARLAVLGTVAGGLGAAPALGLQALFGSTPTVAYAFVVYVIGVIAAVRLPRVYVDDPEDASDDQVDIRSAGVRLAASAMSVLRAVAGFVFWLMVFAYGNNDIDTSGLGKGVGLAVRSALGFSIEGDNSQPAWKLGFVLASIGLGIFLGNVLAPRLRERLVEEHMIVGALGAILAAAVAAVWAGGLSGAVLLALVVGIAPASAKLAFDSLVQRDAPGANHGAAFGRFETRFQIASVIGSVIAVAPRVVIPVRVGAFLVAIAALVAGAMYLVGSRAMREGAPPISFGRRRGAGGAPAADDADHGATSPADSAPPGARPEVVEVYTARPTLEVQTVDPSRPPAPTAPADPPEYWSGSTDPGPVSASGHGVDFYDQAFADRPVEPPEWSEALFGSGDDQEPFDPGLGDPDPTPPFGTPRV